MKPFDAGEMSLRDVLAKLGYTYAHTTMPNGVRTTNILNESGIAVFCGNAGDTWTWLRETNKIL